MLYQFLMSRLGVLFFWPQMLLNVCVLGLVMGAVISVLDGLPPAQRVRRLLGELSEISGVLGLLGTLVGLVAIFDNYRGGGLTEVAAGFGVAFWTTVVAVITSLVGTGGRVLVWDVLGAKHNETVD
jgi:hypothetical protein